MPKIRKTLEPYWQTTDGTTVRLYQGDVIDMLRRLPAASVQCVITSPPYWGLRSYLDGSHADKVREIGSEKLHDCLGWARGVNCAERDWATGCHVCRMVLVFREVRRVLRDDGTVWLNYGDSYNGGPPGGKSAIQEGNRGSFGSQSIPISLKSGNLCGVPWRVALALQADGWILRQDIIWAKPSPMPESVRNRCTKAHEYVFLLAKRMGYYYDAEAIKEKADTANDPPRVLAPKQAATEFDGRINHNKDHASAVLGRVPNRNKRSVWNVASFGYAGCHFATFPPKLIEPMMLAGTSERGCCAKCGAPWRRVVETEALRRSRPNDYVKRTGAEGTGNSCANSVAGVDVKTLGWEPTCKCDAGVVPCTVMDIFVGSGTTCCVALDKGRRSIGIDLSEAYLRDNAVVRIEGELMARPALVGLTGRAAKKLRIGRELT